MKTFRIFLKSGNHFDIECKNLKYQTFTKTSEIASYEIEEPKKFVVIVVTQIEAILEL